MIEKEDVISVADSLGIQVNPEQIERIIELYPDAQKQCSNEIWTLVVEQLIIEVVDGI